MTRTFKISNVISTLFLGLIRLCPIWERKQGDLFNVMYLLVVVTLFLWQTIKKMIEPIWLIRQRHNLTLKHFIPYALMTVSFFIGIFNPIKIDQYSMKGSHIISN